MNDGQNSKKAILNVHLRAARERRGWSQRDLANELGISELTVGRWERGERVPQLLYRAKLAELFGMTAEELGIVPQNRMEDASPQVDEQAEKANEAYDKIQITALPSQAQAELPFVSTIHRVWRSSRLPFRPYTSILLALVLLSSIALSSTLFIEGHLFPSSKPTLSTPTSSKPTLTPPATFQPPAGWKQLINDPMNVPDTWSDNLPDCLFKNRAFHLMEPRQDYCVDDVANDQLRINLLHTYTYQMQMSLLKGQQSGIIFCKAHSSFYKHLTSPYPPYRYFGVTADGHYDLFFDEGNGDHELATGTSSYIIKGYNHFNTLGVIVNNGNIDMYINNHFVQRYHDLSPCDGGILGIEGTSYPLGYHMPPLEAIYKNMSVWGPDITSQHQ